jgi:hypothetical protein
MSRVRTAAFVVLVFIGCKTTTSKVESSTPPPPENAATQNPDGGGAPGTGTGTPPAPAKPAPAKAAKKPAPHTVDNRKLILVGEGARVRDGQKLYDMQMWIDEEDGKRSFPALAMRAGGRTHAHLMRGDHATQFLIWGHFAKQAVLKFTSAVKSDVMRADVKSALEEVSGADTFLTLLPDAASGDEWLLTTRDDGAIEVTAGAETKAAQKSPRLVRALWTVWLGARPLSTELRQKLVEHVDVLR